MLNDMLGLIERKHGASRAELLRTIGIDPHILEIGSPQLKGCALRAVVRQVSRIRQRIRPIGVDVATLKDRYYIVEIPNGPENPDAALCVVSARDSVPVGR
jgi:hypothetical protein